MCLHPAKILPILFQQSGYLKMNAATLLFILCRPGRFSPPGIYKKKMYIWYNLAGETYNIYNQFQGVTSMVARIILSIFCLSLCAGPVWSTEDITIVPWPKTVNIDQGGMKLTTESRIVINKEELKPLAAVLSEELSLLTGLKLDTVYGKPQPGDIALAIDPSIEGEAYSLKLDKTALVRGGNYKAAALGTVSLIQSIKSRDEMCAFPKCTINDSPDKSYRGVMIDAARRYNTIDELKQCVIMCRLYKIPYMHIHLTDDHAWTFPSKKYPKLGSTNRGFRGPAPKVYKRKDLIDLVTFADARGVTLVPELDVPGHTDQLRIPYPEIFDANDGPAHMAIVNMASEEAYEGLDILIGEMLEIFKSTPYFHIGADEARIDRAKLAPSYEAYCKKHKLKNPYELYIHFINRLDAIVKKHGRQTIVWGDFHGDDVPEDVIPMCWRNNSKAPKAYVNDGYKIINATWNPLYVVNQTWDTVNIVEDARGKHRPETIYAWNLKEFDTTTLPSDEDIIGAQICAWESGGEIQVPSLRSRIPAMSERIWNMNAGKSYEDFKQRYDAVDPKLDKLIRPYITEENSIKAAEIKKAGPAVKKAPKENPNHFADPYNPPFDITDEAREARKRIYSVPGLENLSGKDSPLKEGMRMSFFGDSITWQKKYVTEIHQALAQSKNPACTSVMVFNRGVNGAGIKHIRDGVSNFYRCTQAPFNDVLVQDKPDIVVMFIGINDILFLGTKPADYEKALNELMQTAKEAGVKYFVLASPWLRQELPNGTNPRDTAIQAYAALCQKTAEKDWKPMKTGFVNLHERAMAYLQNNNVELLDSGKLKFRPKGVLTYDGLHPNQAGNKFIAEQIADAIYNACK